MTKNFNAEIVPSVYGVDDNVSAFCKGPKCILIDAVFWIRDSLILKVDGLLS